MAEDKLTYLEHLIPVAPVPSPRQQLSRDVHVAHTHWVNTSKEIACLMLVSMTLELQTNLEHFAAYNMLQCGEVPPMWKNKKLKPGALNLYVGNGYLAVVEAIGSFNLCLANGLCIIQEFLDQRKERRIISQCTPPYTPQHNGVSERRNRTMLDMVRSMISQITLPKSFWDYALESVARILNMVLIKRLKRHHMSFISQEASGSLEDLKVIQEKDMHPSKSTSEHHDDDEQ
ncbi:zinc finger, CCHC-type containing protein [Tanacetum coccineum]